jgi:hypothetical protein
MRLTTRTAAPARAGIPARMSTWIGRGQRSLADRVHAAGDDCARRYGWEVTKSTGRFGFGARSYRDPRFDDRRLQLSPAEQSRTFSTIASNTAQKPALSDDEHRPAQRQRRQAREGDGE